MTEDLIQEVFLKFWRDPHAFDPARGSEFGAWFMRVAVNLALDETRRVRPEALPEDFDVAADDVPDAETHLIADEQDLRLKKALLDLPARQRMALVLFTYEDYKLGDVAELMQITSKAVESLLTRARDNLKKKWMLQAASEERRSHAG